MASKPSYDDIFLVIGGGIGGAAAAYHLRNRGKKVIILERESIPDRHSTGRTAAVFLLANKDPITFALAYTGLNFFTEHGILTPRGGLQLATKGQEEELLAQRFNLASKYLNIKTLNHKELVNESWAKRFMSGYPIGGIWEPGAQDINVKALHNLYLSEFRRDEDLFFNANIKNIEHTDGRWVVKTSLGTFNAGTIVNASGAWGDKVSNLAGVDPLGLEPRRRTAVKFEVQDDVDISNYPFVIDIGQKFFFRPWIEKHGHYIIASPMDQTPAEPGIAEPEEKVIQETRELIEPVLGPSTLGKMKAAWTGQRTFVPKHPGPVIEFAKNGPRWINYEGLGGDGIMSSFGGGTAVADLATCGKICDEKLLEMLRVAHLDEKALSSTPDMGL